MVEFLTPRMLPQARSAGQVSNAGSQALKELAGATQQAANTFSQYYEKKAAIEGDLLLAQIQEEWTRGYKERASSAGPGFASTTLNDYDQFVQDKMDEYQTRMTEAGMRNVPARNRDEINAALAKYRLKIETQAIEREAAARAAASAAARNETVRLRTNAILSDPSLMQDAIDSAATDAERNAYIKAGLNAQLLADNPQAVMEAMHQGTFDASLSPSEKLSFMKAAQSGIDSLDRERQTQARIEQQAFVSDREEALAFVQANGFVPPALDVSPEDFDRMYADDPEQGAKARAAYEDGLQFSEALYNVSLASPDQIANHLQVLQEKISAPGNTEADVKNLNAYVSAIQTRSTAIVNDAAGFVVQQEDTVAKLYDMVQAETDMAASGDQNADPASVTSHYITALNTMYDSMGVPTAMRTVAPQSQVKQDVARLNAAGPDVAGQMLKAMMQQWGDAAPVYIAQLQKEGLAPEYVTAMRFSDDPGLSQAIINVVGMSESDLKKGLDTTSVTDLNREMVSYLEEYRRAFETAGTPQATTIMNEQSDVATKVALQYMRAGMSPAAAAEKVTAQMFPEQPVINNNASFLLPDTFGENAVLTGLEQAQEESALRAADIAPINDVRYPDFADKEVTIKSAASTGVWVNNSTGDGVQLMISVDGYMIPLLRNDGSNYEIKFSDAASATPSGGIMGWFATGMMPSAWGK